MLAKVKQEFANGGQAIQEVLEKYRGVAIRVMIQFDSEGREVSLEVSVPTTVFKRVETIHFSN